MKAGGTATRPAFGPRLGAGIECFRINAISFEIALLQRVSRSRGRFENAEVKTCFGAPDPSTSRQHMPWHKRSERDLDDAMLSFHGWAPRPALGQSALNAAMVAVAALPALNGLAPVTMRPLVTEKSAKGSFGAT